jgi:diguanylate cyclase (GGDEF)-like protein
VAAPLSVPLTARELAAGGAIVLLAAVAAWLGARGARRRRRVLELEGEAERLGDALAEAERRLENAARTDFLTGLPNRRRFLERAESERQALRRTGRGFALIRVDLDHLRAINRRYGSECGDRVLVAVASTLRDTLRERDVAARWGSEEFVLLLPETDLDGARTLGEKVRSRIASLRVVHGDRELEVTCTLGLTEADTGDSIDALAVRADAALAAGKGAGGDRVEIWTPDTPPGG